MKYLKISLLAFGLIPMMSVTLDPKIGQEIDAVRTLEHDLTGKRQELQKLSAWKPADRAKRKKLESEINALIWQIDEMKMGLGEYID